MGLLEALRDRHQRKHYDRPMKRREQAPVARNLLAEIDRYIEVTPEYKRAKTERRLENKATQIPNVKPIAYPTAHGHFSILRGAYETENGSRGSGFVLNFEPTVDGERDPASKLRVVVYHQTMSAHTPGKYANEPFTSIPYDIGSFSIEGTVPGSEGKKLVPNSHETWNEIKSLLPKLFPTLPQHEKMMSGVSER